MLKKLQGSFEILENGFNITCKFIHFVLKNLLQVRYTLVTVSMVPQLSKCLKFEAVWDGVEPDQRVITRPMRVLLFTEWYVNHLTD